MSDRYLLDVDPRVVAIWDTLHHSTYEHGSRVVAFCHGYVPIDCIPLIQHYLRVCQCQQNNNGEYVSRITISNHNNADTMVTSSNGNLFRRVTGPLCAEFTGHRWIPLTKASDAELWCFLWSAPEQTNGSVNNRDTGDLRRHRAHYDVTVMEQTVSLFYGIYFLGHFTVTELVLRQWIIACNQ